MSKIRLARIKCPHCHKPITLRDAGAAVDAKTDREVWKAFDKAFEAMNAAFHEVDKLFLRLGK